MQRLHFWWRVIKLATVEFINDDCLFLAAAIAFYAFLSVFPLCFILLAVMSVMWSGDAQAEAVRVASDFLPRGAAEAIFSHLEGLAQNATTVGFTSFVFFIFSGRALFDAMENSLHKAWEMPHLRTNYFHRAGVFMGLVLLCGAIAVATMVFSAWLGVAEAYVARLHLPYDLERVNFWHNVHAFGLIPVAMFLVFLLLYRILPSHGLPWSHAVPGALFATIAWKVTGSAFIYYTMTIGRQSYLYGSMFGIVGLQMWLYIGGVVFLAGAELVYAYSREKRARQPV